MGPGVSVPTLIPAGTFLPDLGGTASPSLGYAPLTLGSAPLVLGGTSGTATLTGSCSLQKSCTEEGRGRPGSDRKRKFLETDLAHDSEGRQGWPGRPWPRLACLVLEIILQIMAVLFILLWSA